MKIDYRRLTENELDTFINMRINQLREEGAKEEIDLVPALKDYYTRHMADGTFVSWLAFDGDDIIGTSGMPCVENRLILDAQVEELGCSPVCLPTLIIEERALQRNCYPVL